MTIIGMFPTHQEIDSASCNSLQPAARLDDPGEEGYSELQIEGLMAF